MVIWVTYFDRLLLVVALGIPVMHSEQRSSFVNSFYSEMNRIGITLLYVYVNSTQLRIVDILTTALGYQNHAGPKSK